MKIKGTLPTTLEGMESLMRRMAKEGRTDAGVFLVLIQAVQSAQDEIEGLQKTVASLRDEVRRFHRGDD